MMSKDGSGRGPNRPGTAPEGMTIPFTANISFFRAVITSPGHFSEPGQMKKKNSTPTPHDATFRQFLANPDVARDFMTLHLPAELQVLCDLNTLKLESGTFVEDDLRQYASDILWSMKTTTGDDGYIHLLLEHQSSADKNMAFRQCYQRCKTDPPQRLKIDPGVNLLL